MGNSSELGWRLAGRNDSNPGRKPGEFDKTQTFTTRIRMMAALLLLSLSMTIGLVFWSAKSQDVVAVSESVRLANTAMKVTVGNVKKTLTDYTRWDEAYFKLSETFDADWFDENFGDGEYFLDTFGITSSFLIGPDNRFVRHMYLSEIHPEFAGALITEHIEGGIAGLADRARISVDGEFLVTGGVVRMEGQLYFAALRVVHPHSEELLATKPITPENAVISAFMLPVDAEFLEMVSSDFGLPGLHFSSAEESAGNAAISLVAPNGMTMGKLVWQADRPGQFVRQVILPSLLVVVLVIGIFAWHLLRVIQQQQRELCANMNRAVSADRSKTEFLANMSHELRTPLNAIIGFSETMHCEIFGPLNNKKYAEYAANIVESGHYLLRIITDILEMSKVEAGKYKLNEEKIALRDLVDAVTRLIGPRLEEKGVGLDIEIARSISCIYGDEQAIKQVLLNFLSNAAKFTPDGGSIVLRAEYLPSGQVRISVSDTGIGIPEDQLPLVTRPFHQVGSSLTRSENGTGLGLPLAAAMVKLHGGGIEIKSKVNEGTTVAFTLPAERIVLLEAA